MTNGALKSRDIFFRHGSRDAATRMRFTESPNSVFNCRLWIARRCGTTSSAFDHVTTPDGGEDGNLLWRLPVEERQACRGHSKPSFSSIGRLAL
jgi:hypothetical protein